jgi:phage portal protein BeeE
MTSQELADMAASFAAAREEQTIAALNEFVDYVPNTANPDDLQLTDARTFQSLEMARLANIPPFLVGAPTGGGMNYQNSAESNKLLYLYGSKPYIECIEQTLSMNNVIPRGRYVELDVSTYLYENDLAGGDSGNAALPSPPAITIERERE